MTLVAMTGRCHICRSFDLLEFLGWSPHWVCGTCKESLGIKQVEALVSQPELDCCGPVAMVA